MTTPAPGWTILDWRKAAVSGELSEHDYLVWFSQFSEADPAWIHCASEEEVLAQLSSLWPQANGARESKTDLPLFGVPFAVKDNIDVKGWPTTAACPAFSYVAEQDATVVRLLRSAGAIVCGKTNLDQFATGLVGTRSPYGVVPSAFNADFIAGGSSSGSASLVTRGLLPFTLGTDTAGSGRVPAAFGNVVGLKPTRGTVSTRGVVPACRTLDCVSVFALTAGDAAVIGDVVREFDVLDDYARSFPASAWPEKGEDPRALRAAPRVGILQPLEFFGDVLAQTAFEQSLDRLEGQGWKFSPVDAAPFYALAELLYGGPWVAERSLTAEHVLRSNGELDPAVRSILEPARSITAEQGYRSEYARAELARKIQLSFEGIDAVLVPTTPTTFRIDEVSADPLGTNARLGTYTNFTNLADLSAVAVPGCFRADGLPAGITLLGPALAELVLLRLADQAQRAMDVPLGATQLSFADASSVRASLAANEHGSHELPHPAPARAIQVAVVGAHLSGMALNHQLTQRGARLVRATKTAPRYRLFLLAHCEPEKPGLLRVEGGSSIAVEVWEMSISAFGSFACDVPAPLGIGNVELLDGSWVKGFICEPCGFERATDITECGGFAEYLRQRETSAR